MHTATSYQNTEILAARFMKVTVFYDIPSTQLYDPKNGGLEGSLLRI